MTFSAAKVEAQRQKEQYERQCYDLLKAQLPQLCYGCCRHVLSRQWLPLVSTPTDLAVRALASGDRYQALGAPGSRKLKDCLLDRGVGEKERKLLPVVSTSGGLIIWVPGLPVSDCCRVGPDTKEALRLTYAAGEAL